MEAREARLVLNALPHVGPVLLRRLLDAHGGDPAAVLGAARKRLTAVDGVGPKTAAAIAGWREHFDLGREQRLLASAGVRFVVPGDAGYPDLLHQSYDPPIGLYWKGDYVLDRPCIAIVGSRRATLYGAAVAGRLARDLAGRGFCIVSGLARGIDTAAHEGALAAGGRTIAVLGCGIDIVYPPENLALYRSIAGSGAIVSEFPFGRRADRQTFPMRNRVVAAMSVAVVVVESDVSGGSMITARFAGEQGRLLFAVPGRIDQAGSRGCHQLIRDGATLVTSAEDIFAELDYRGDSLRADAEQAAQRPVPALSEPEQRLMAVFEGGEAPDLDAVALATGLPAGEASALLTGLELRALVIRRADGRYEARL